MESCDPRFDNLPDGGSGVISRCSKPPNVGAVRQDGIGHWQGESPTLLGKTCNNNNNNNNIQCLVSGSWQIKQLPLRAAAVSESFKAIRVREPVYCIKYLLSSHYLLMSAFHLART